MILIVSFCTLCTYGQCEFLNNREANESAYKTTSGQLNFENDSIPIVQYVKAKRNDRPAVFYINGDVVNSTILKTIDSQFIDSVRVEKDELELDGKKYYGQVFLKMKNNYTPKLITLNDLKSKYLNPSDNPVIFMIDNDVINSDYENYLVDENYILKIVVDNVKNDNLNIEIVRLQTRSEKNIIDSKKIMIRGLEELTIE